MRQTMFTLILLLMTATPAFAELKVVATLPWIGSLAKEIGGTKVSVTTLAKPNQDPHYIEARPSMILAARKADILMYNGLDLEIGYLPLLLEQSRNADIAPGHLGNFDCSRFVRTIERQATVDRSMGDQHPLGNPHYHFSPSNVVRVAEGMTEALVQLDGANAGHYRANMSSFKERLQERQKKWGSLPLKGKRFVAYHKLFEYLAREYGFHIVGYVEPKPGIPPSAAHVETMVRTMKGSKLEGLLTTNFYGKKESGSLAAKTGVKVVILPADVGGANGTNDYLSFMDLVLTSLI